MEGKFKQKWLNLQRNINNNSTWIVKKGGSKNTNGQDAHYEEIVNQETQETKRVPTWFSIYQDNEFVKYTKQIFEFKRTKFSEETDTDGEKYTVYNPWITDTNPDYNRFEFERQIWQDNISDIRIGLYIWSNEFGMIWAGWHKDEGSSTDANKVEGMVYYLNAGEEKIALPNVDVTITEIDELETFGQIKGKAQQGKTGSLILTNDRFIGEPIYILNNGFRNEKILKTDANGKFLFRTNHDSFEIKLEKPSFIERKSEKTYYRTNVNHGENEDSIATLILKDLRLDPIFTSWNKKNKTPIELVRIGNTYSMNAPTRTLYDLGFSFIPKLLVWQGTVDAGEWVDAKKIKYIDTETRDEKGYIVQTKNQEIVNSVEGFGSDDNILPTSEIVNAKKYKFLGLENGSYRIDGTYFNKGTQTSYLLYGGITNSDKLWDNILLTNEKKTFISQVDSTCAKGELEMLWNEIGRAHV